MAAPPRSLPLLSALLLLPAIVLLGSGAARALPGDPAPMAEAGRVLLSQDALTVQTKEQLEWIYTVGEAGLDLGDELRLRDPEFHGMRWSKWGDLSPHRSLCDAQTDGGSRASWGLVGAYATRDGLRLDDVTLAVARTNCGDTAASCDAGIHDPAESVVYLERGSLLPGDLVHVVHGDVDGCYEQCAAAGEADCGYCEDCGFEAPDRSFPRVWWTAEECIDGACAELEPVSFEVVARRDLARVFVAAPSQVVAGEPFRLKTSLLDKYGNPIASEPTTLTVSLQGAPGQGDGQQHTFTEGDGGWHDFAVRLDEPGVYRLVVTPGQGPTGTSNPIEVLAEAPDRRIYWGDIHVHHGYTWVDEGARLDFNHVYGRDVVGLDVVSESMKASGIEIDGEALWTELQDNCTQYTEPGEYVVLLGFEWIGDDAARAACGSAAGCSEGHHNIYYDRCDGELGTQDLDVVDSLTGERGLWPWLDEVRDRLDIDAVSVPHAMRWTYYNFDVYYGPQNADAPREPGYPGTQTLVEIYSEWGDGTGDPDEPGSVQEMMSRGHRLGWLGGSDNHDGWMGNPYAKNRTGAGIGAFIASELTHAGVFEAMKARRTYATTGHRPIVRFEVQDGPHAVTQGEELLAREPVLSWRYHGTDEIRSLYVYRLAVQEGAEQELVFSATGGLDATGSLDLLAEGLWDGQEDALFWLEVAQEDREKAWSSPIWLTGDCTRLDLGATDPYGRCVPEAIDVGDTGDASQLGVLPTDGDPRRPPRAVPGPAGCDCQGSGAGAAGVVAALALVGRRRRRRPS